MAKVDRGRIHLWYNTRCIGSYRFSRKARKLHAKIKNYILKTFKSVHRVGEGYRCEFRDRGCYYEVDKKSSMDQHYQRCHMRKCHICNMHIATFDFEAHTNKHLDEANRQNEAVINLIYWMLHIYWWIA